MGRARLAGVAALAMLFAGVAGASPPPPNADTGAGLGPDHPALIHGVDMRHDPDGSLDLVVTRGAPDGAFVSTVDALGLDVAGGPLVFAGSRWPVVLLLFGALAGLGAFLWWRSRKDDGAEALAEPAPEAPEEAPAAEPATGEQPAPPAMTAEEQPGPPATEALDEAPPLPDETETPPAAAGGGRDGDEQWEEFDGPHPFEILDPDGRVDIAVSHSIGSKQGIPLPTVDQYLPTADDRTMGYDDLASITDDQLEAAFGPLQKVFGKAKDVAREAPILQVTLTLHVVQVLATCERKLGLVDGEWQVTSERRCTVTRTAAKPRRDFARATISGPSKDVVKEVKAVFDQARAAIERSRPLDEYCAACREGKRS